MPTMGLDQQCSLYLMVQGKVCIVINNIIINANNIAPTLCIVYNRSVCKKASEDCKLVLDVEKTTEGNKGRKEQRS